jgi:hypothetical protein
MEADDDDEWHDSEEARVFGEMVGEMWEEERKAKKAKEAENGEALAKQLAMHQPTTPTPVAAGNAATNRAAMTTGRWSLETEWKLNQALYPRITKPDWAAISAALGRDIKVCCLTPTPEADNQSCQNKDAARSKTAKDRFKSTL